MKKLFLAFVLLFSTLAFAAPQYGGTLVLVEGEIALR